MLDFQDMSRTMTPLVRRGLEGHAFWTLRQRKGDIDFFLTLMILLVVALGDSVQWRACFQSNAERLVVTHVFVPGRSCPTSSRPHRSGAEIRVGEGT